MSDKSLHLNPAENTQKVVKMSDQDYFFAYDRFNVTFFYSLSNIYYHQRVSYLPGRCTLSPLLPQFLLPVMYRRKTLSSTEKKQLVMT